jgi:hypothetical protein
MATTGDKTMKKKILALAVALVWFGLAYAAVVVAL